MIERRERERGGDPCKWHDLMKIESIVKRMKFNLEGQIIVGGVLVV